MRIRARTVYPMKMRVGSTQIKSEYRVVSVANETLYQLSYTPVVGKEISTSVRFFIK